MIITHTLTINKSMQDDHAHSKPTWVESTHKVWVGEISTHFNMGRGNSTHISWVEFYPTHSTQLTWVE